jgi:hypothetical protein
MAALVLPIRATHWRTVVLRSGDTVRPGLVSQVDGFGWFAQPLLSDPTQAANSEHDRLTNEHANAVHSRPRPARC